MACRRAVDVTNVERQKCALVHSLTTLSTCLAAVGRDEDALVVSEEAAMIYGLSVSNMWLDTFIFRTQELGANAFHSLSLRLAGFGCLDEALEHAEQAIDLYRELVSLIPRHFPTLAFSLQNLASILWKVGRHKESLLACEEATEILRTVANTETYFLPALVGASDQLAAYLSEKGNGARASAVTIESTEIRRMIACQPSQRNFFSEMEKETWQEDEEDEYGETATELYDEYYDLLLCCNVRDGGGSRSSAAADTPFSCESALHRTTSQISESGAEEGVQEAEITKLGQTHLTNFLAKPLEVNISLKVKMSSTPMDVLWWIGLVIFGGILWSRI
ncbi:hypothetical protein DFH07DRAFT_790986 [Mycena maculata]|uniref:Tetratricopeptide repeat n=1 Tax=Mycena maculata TaxID=230809 RepID=A0AAD7KCJ9_9AGAR|nr:hypothetical protein DFH07DRAFT_790986 [Mycena maculata]